MDKGVTNEGIMTDEGEHCQLLPSSLIPGHSERPRRPGVLNSCLPPFLRKLSWPLPSILSPLRDTLINNVLLFTYTMISFPSGSKEDSCTHLNSHPLP